VHAWHDTDATQKIRQGRIDNVLVNLLNLAVSCRIGTRTRVGSRELRFELDELQGRLQIASIGLLDQLKDDNLTPASAAAPTVLGDVNRLVELTREDRCEVLGAFRSPPGITRHAGLE